MPRKKAQPVAQPSPDQLLNPSAADLIAEFVRTRDWLEAEGKRFDEHLRPYRDRQAAIQNQLLGMMNGQKLEALPTEHGTASKSTLMNLSVSEDAAPYEAANGRVTGREALIDFAMDNWDVVGNELLLVKPQMEAVKRWMETHDNQPPPGVAISWFTRVNVRRA